MYRNPRDGMDSLCAPFAVSGSNHHREFYRTIIDLSEPGKKEKGEACGIDNVLIGLIERTVCTNEEGGCWIE